MLKSQTNASSSPTAVPGGLVLAAAWSWRLLVVGATVALVFMALYELRVVTLPMFVALLISTLLVPPARHLERIGVKPGLATAIVFLLFFASIGLVVYLLVGPMIAQFKDMGPEINKSLDNIQNWLKTGPLHLTDDDLTNYITQARESLKNNSATLRSQLTHGATIVGESLIGLFVTLIMTFFFIKDGSAAVRSAVGRFPENRRQLVTSCLQRAYVVLGGYLRGVAMTGVVDAVCIGIGLVILGVPFVAPIMLLTFFGAFFPLVGATVAGAVAVLVALVSVGFVKAMIVVAIVLGVQQLEGHLLQPVLVGRAVSLHPVVILFSLAAGSITAGLLGAFISVPLVAMLVAIIREIDASRRPQEQEQVAIQKLT